MAIVSPFQPSAGATAGNTIKVTGSSAPASVPSVAAWSAVLANQIMITNAGTVLAFVRVSPEAVPVATAKDLPVLAGSHVIIQNPHPNGNVGLAVLSSVAAAVDVYFTPGVGGV